ncbi:MAG: hypothetical protein ABSD58_12850 [Verrucomicrobiia bacterium]|jgi:hypothetical protein
MNRRISYLAIAMGVVFTILCPSAFAKKGKPGTEMKLVSVDVPNNKITVSDPNGNITTLAVMQVTTVTLNGQPAKLRDLHRGMHVNLSVSQGGKVADKIDATTPPAKNTN